MQRGKAFGLRPLEAQAQQPREAAVGHLAHELLHAGKVSVKVLPTHDKWFGVTYAEDKQTVIDSFAKLVADGVYKKDLFSDLKK